MEKQYFFETASPRMLEFDRIIEKLLENANTLKAKERIRSLEPVLAESEVRARLKETTEARILLDRYGDPPVTALEGIAELIERAEKESCLSAAELEKIGVTLTAVKRLKDYLCRGKACELSLPYYEENLDSLEEIRGELNQKIRSGRVDDYASKLLKSLRDGIDRTQAKMREKAEGVIRANKECMSDHFSTIRNGRICIPVKKEYKFRIGGSVIDKSSTGSTLFIEPPAVARLFEELQEFKIDAENEERRILYELTAMLSDQAEVIRQNAKTIEKLDFIFAKGKLSLSYEGVEPEINTERRICLEKGRHPLMDKRVNVPLDFEIGTGINGVIITGPNTGGKTVAIKTVALSCMMAQCGLHVAAEKARICMNNLILCDIGDGQNLSENLSTLNPDFKADETGWKKEKMPHVRKQKAVHADAGLSQKFRRGDSVMIYPDKKIGIVCEPVNEKGVLCVQLQDKKIYINHKRVRLHVAAEKLYPEDYDFSIIFDSVETRKARHQMERKYVDTLLNLSEE